MAVGLPEAYSPPIVSYLLWNPPNTYSLRMLIRGSHETQTLPFRTARTTLIAKRLQGSRMLSTCLPDSVALRCLRSGLMAKNLIQLCVRLWASNGLSRRAMLEPAREPSIVGLQDYEDLCVLSLAS